MSTVAKVLIWLGIVVLGLRDAGLVSVVTVVSGDQTGDQTPVFWRIAMTMRSILATSMVVMLASLMPVTRSSPHAAVNAVQSPSATAQAQRDASQPKMPDMMKMHEQMMAEMKASNEKLDQLVTEMDAATGDAKVNATAAVVKELVRQHRAMCDGMGEMHKHMMGKPGMMMR